MSINSFTMEMLIFLAADQLAVKMFYEILFLLISCRFCKICVLKMCPGNIGKLNKIDNQNYIYRASTAYTFFLAKILAKIGNF